MSCSSTRTRRMPRASWPRRLPVGGSSCWSARSPRPTWTTRGSSSPPPRTADVDAAVARWCEERRTWCVRGATGTARTVAATRHDDLVVGVVSDADPDPRRCGVGARRPGAAPVHRARSTCGDGAGALGGWCWSAAGRGTRACSPSPGWRPSRPPTSSWPTGSGPPGLLDRLPATSRSSTWARPPGDHPVPQAEINRLLVEQARRGAGRGAAQGWRPVRLRARRRGGARLSRGRCRRRRWCPASARHSRCRCWRGSR